MASAASPDFFDDLASDTDFSSLPSAPNAKKGLGGLEIPTGDGESKKRPASYYRKPGMFAIIAASINIFAFLSIAIYECVTVGRELGSAGIFAIPFMIQIGIWALFNISANAHAVIGGRNVLKRKSMGSGTLACGELFIAPLFLNAVFCLNAFQNEGASENPWLLPIIAGCIFVAYNWPASIWLSITLSGNQAKIDFEEYDSGELDELAEKLVNSASGGGH